MAENFKERCEFEVGLVIANQQANYIIKTIESFEDIWFEQYLKILIFAGSSCFLPKKQILDTKTNQPYIHLTARKPKKNLKIEHPHDCVWDILKEAGIPLELKKDYIKFKKVYYSKDIQKKRENKYFYLDIFK